jgi:hypothetical protein
MFAIVLLVIVTGGIAAFARGRGGKPWLWGALTVVGSLVAPRLVAFVAVVLGADPDWIKENDQLWFICSVAAWVAIVAFCARFLLGRGYAKPDSMWSCKNCNYLNQKYAVISEACSQPNASKAPPIS